jgi:hypothetical protein
VQQKTGAFLSPVTCGRLLAGFSVDSPAAARVSSLVAESGVIARQNEMAFSLPR